MKYRVSLSTPGTGAEAREREVDVTFTPSGEPIVTLDGRTVDVEARRAPGGLLLRMGNKVHDVAITGSDEMQLAAMTSRAVATVANERASKDRQRSAGAAAKELRAPMPGRIVRILVKAGEAVTAGQPLIVMEAMKMENELRATANGVVREVLVSEGGNVESRTLLLAFE